MTRWTVHLLWASLLVAIVTLSRAETGPAGGKPGEAKVIPGLRGAEKIAVVDVKWIVMHYVKCQEQLADVRSKLEEAEAAILTRTADIEKLDRNQSDAATSATEREENLAKREELLKALTAAEEQIPKLKQAKIKIYIETLVAIDRKISDFAERNELDLVLNFCPEPKDVDQPRAGFLWPPNQEKLPSYDELLGQMSRAVLYTRPTSDITPWILKALIDESKPESSRPTSGF